MYKTTFSFPEPPASIETDEKGAPAQGELFCAAVAACIDSAIRITANRLGVTLTRLRVEAAAGSRRIEIGVVVETAHGVEEEQVALLVKAAQETCADRLTMNCIPKEMDIFRH